MGKSSQKLDRWSEYRSASIVFQLLDQLSHLHLKLGGIRVKEIKGHISDKYYLTKCRSIVIIIYKIYPGTYLALMNIVFEYFTIITGF